MELSGFFEQAGSTTTLILSTVAVLIMATQALQFGIFWQKATCRNLAIITFTEAAIHIALGDALWHIGINIACGILSSIFVFINIEKYRNDSSTTPIRSVHAISTVPHQTPTVTTVKNIACERCGGANQVENLQTAICVFCGDTVIKKAH